VIFFSGFAAAITITYVPGLTAFLPAIVVLVVFVMNWLYFALFEIFDGGKSPGKRVAGIRVIKDTGRPVNVYESLTRNIVGVADFLRAFYGIGVLTMMCNRNSRRLGDFVAGTIVVYDRPQEAIAPLPEPENRVAASTATRLTVDELALVEAYLAR